MATIEMTATSFETIVATGIVLVDWWAAWCGPCRAFAPIYAAAADRHSDIVFGKVDTDAEPALAAAFEIRSIPTMMLFRDGILLFEHAGVLPGAALDEVIEKARALDMDDIRGRAAG